MQTVPGTQEPLVSASELPGSSSTFHPQKLHRPAIDLTAGSHRCVRVGAAARDLSSSPWGERRADGERHPFKAPAKDITSVGFKEVTFLPECCPHFWGIITRRTENRILVNLGHSSHAIYLKHLCALRIYIYRVELGQHGEVPEKSYTYICQSNAEMLIRALWRPSVGFRSLELHHVRSDLAEVFDLDLHGLQMALGTDQMHRF